MQPDISQFPHFDHFNELDNLMCVVGRIVPPPAPKYVQALTSSMCDVTLSGTKVTADIIELR